MQTFLFDGERLVVLDVLGHPVERRGQGAEFVARPDRDARLEVTRGELADAVAERRQVLRHAA